MTATVHTCIVARHTTDKNANKRRSAFQPSTAKRFQVGNSFLHYGVSVLTCTQYSWAASLTAPAQPVQLQRQHQVTATASCPFKDMLFLSDFGLDLFTA